MAAFLLHPLGIMAQGEDPLLEGRLLRAAASQESRGELPEAERLLRDLMEQMPTSTGGLFALERVLRSQGRITEVLPVARRYQEIEPDAAAPRILTLRVYTELERDDELQAAANEWLDQSGSSAEPYREVSRILRRVFGSERALAVLERGRTSLGQPALFALEVGDLLLDLDRARDAVLEWAVVIGDDGARVSAVMRRVTELPGDRAELVRPLVKRLGRPPTTPARRRAGARIALEAGLSDEARELAEAALPGLEGQARRGFLTTLARQAEETGGHAVALWAYQSLEERAVDAAEARALGHRVTAAALDAGDTATALRAQRSIAESLPVGSVERRRALAESLRLGVAADTERIRDDLARFRREFPEAPELDELVVTLAVRVEAEGDVEGARALLGLVDGPRSSLERGYLYFSTGDVEAGRGMLLEAVAGLPATVATELITLLTLLDRLEGEARGAVLRSVVLAHRGRPGVALEEIEGALALLPDEDRAPLLAHGARIADASGVPVEAARLRERLVQEHPGASEVPEATLDLARFKGETPGGVPEAIKLLEELILSRPNSAVVPTARRELQKLQGGRGG